MVLALRLTVKIGRLCAWFGVATFGALIGSTVQAVEAVEASVEPNDGPAFSAEAVAFFESSVRPILVEHCLNCHGPEAQKGGLRLDSRERILAGGDSGPVVELGSPQDSLLVWAVEYEDFPQMPPKGELLEEQQRVLARWIADGLAWSDPNASLEESEMIARSESHWAFRTVRDSPVPSGSRLDSGVEPLNAVDAFVQTRLAEQGLNPSLRADRRTLIRRLSFDLLGLPPTVEEVEAFLTDNRPDAVSRLVDRLLASPRYGERWGRYWLDVARYADTKGYVFTEERRYPNAYTYRDYVVKAFNRDTPYDRFIIEQLAADLEADAPMAEEAPESVAALGFLTVGRRFLNNRHDIIDDRIDVTTRGLMGLTVTCARCHDHKYDPIPTADYYSLYGVFASVEEPESLPRLPGGETNPHVESYRAERAKRRADLDAKMEELRAQIEAHLRERLHEYVGAAVRLDFGGDRNARESIAQEDDLRPRLLNWFVDRARARIARATPASDDPFYVWSRLVLNQPDEAQSLDLDSLDQQFESLNPPVNRFVRDRLPHVVRSDKPVDIGIVIASTLSGLDEEATDLDRDTQWIEDRERFRDALYGPDGLASIGLGDVTALLNRAERNERRRLERRIDRLEVEHPGSPPRAMIVRDRQRPVDPYIFERGQPGRRGESVPRRFLELLDGQDRQPFRKGSGRLELARKIADPANPLTARVMINRIWGHHFGRGFVETPSDFGTRSDRPTHPLLLDYLASRFVEDGWSIKRTHRRILLSHTYRQSSTTREDAARTDPENRLVWRMNRRRLEFEPLRDALLAVSGRLEATMGGRSVSITGDDPTPRRTVYAFLDRQNIPGLFRTFDAANPNTSTGRRARTTVPQQALFLLNAPPMIRLARALASEFEDGAVGSRVDQIHRRLFARSTEPVEVALANQFLDRFEALSAESFGQRDPSASWSYGYGLYDEQANRVTRWTALPHWTGEAWQFGDGLPDPVGRYLHLNAEGGHVGPRADRAAIIRWTAPEDLSIDIDGTLTHQSAKGDGVRGRIVSSRRGLLGAWVAHNDNVATAESAVHVEVGETLDFVVDCRDGHAFDSFAWKPRIRATSPSNASRATRPKRWEFARDFHGPLNEPMDAWDAYAHALLMTNEFLFID